jgi:predicted RND superfamily exporter protein
MKIGSPASPKPFVATIRHVAFVALALAILVSIWFVAYRVDLSPHVESDFFFSTEDEAFRASKTIGERFPSRPQLIVDAAGGTVGDQEYVEHIRRLTDALAAVPGVVSVRSLTSGPATPAAVPGSPLWSRLLLTEDAESTQLVVFVEDDAGPAMVADVEAVLAAQERPGFDLEISGVPYVVELIRRHLRRDLRVFSTAAIAVFGLVILVVYRSLPLVVGTLLSCVGACLLTLTTLHLTGTPIGVLTANIATIVFVLTLSHTVFLSSNWRRLQRQRERRTAVDEAVRITFSASFWCMVAALLGFGSLLLANAKPLRELGVSGMVGTAVAIVVAYGFYPWFLARARFAPEPVLGRDSSTVHGGQLPPVWMPAVAGLLAVVAAFGLPRIDTDPSLLTYFAEGSEIRSGLERIDRHGGSSPLYLAVSDPDGRRVVEEGLQPLLQDLQGRLESDPTVAVSLSLPVLVAEARLVPLAAFMPTEQIVEILDGELYDHIARSFVSEDRDQAVFFLRMRETDRDQSRQAVVGRVRAAAVAAGLEVELVGGLFDLQGKLGELVASSIGRELGGLLLFFVGVAAVASRRWRDAAAMVLCLAAVPVLLLGAVGFAGQPVDVISAPGANVAIALGIDAMIHLVMSVRRRRAAGDDDRSAWAAAIVEQRPAILGAMSILAAGFGIFVLSSFPPTQRFGVLVASGSLVSAAMALGVLPWLATRGAGERA